MFRRYTTLNFLCALGAVLTVSYSHADQLSYMDDAGNLRFVDSVSQIPARYRAQVVRPTPTPVMDQAAAMRVQQERMLYDQQQRQRQQQAQQLQSQNDQENMRRRSDDMARRREIERNVQLERDRSGR